MESKSSRKNHRKSYTFRALIQILWFVLSLIANDLLINKTLKKCKLLKTKFFLYYFFKI